MELREQPSSSAVRLTKRIATTKKTYDRGNKKMLFTLPEIKRAIKHMDVEKITVWLEEYGEGYNVYSNVKFTGQSNTTYFDLSEEEKLGKAEARAKRTIESLIKAGYNAEYTGLHC